MAEKSQILIVDDEANLRSTLAMILQRDGYRVSTASSGSEALRLLKAGAYDLVFLDLKMPEMDGLTLLKEIRKQYPDMVITLLTAFATLDSSIEALREGANDYLLKPIDPPQILERVQHLLENHNARRRREIVDEIETLLSELRYIEQPDHPAESTAVQANEPARFLSRGPLTVDLHKQVVILQDEEIKLSPITFDYLVALIRRAPEPVPYIRLVFEAQGFQAGLREAQELARWRIHELRKQIEEDPKNPQLIITVRGTGYRLVV